MSKLTRPMSLNHARSTLTLRSVFITLCVLAGMVAVAALLADASKRGIAAALVIGLLPVMIYAAIRRPLIFPFALYVLLVPFDNLLNVKGFGTITKLLAICSGVSMLFWLIRSKKAIRPPKVMIIWVLFAAWSAMTVFWAIDSDVATSRLFTYAELVALLAIISIMPADLTDLKVVFWSTVAGAVVAASYGAYLFHSGQNLVVEHVGVGSQVGRLSISANNTQIDPNHFGNALLLPIALVSIAALRQRVSFPKVVYIGALLTLLAGVYVSGSREALLSTGVVFAYLMLTKYRYQIAAIAVGLLAMSFMLPTHPWARFANAIQTGGAGRTQIWAVALDALKHYWAKGVGVGNFSEAYDRSFIHVYQSSANAIPHWHFVAHNTLLGVGVELGLIGMALVLLGWVGQWRMLSEVSKDSGLYDLRIALEASIVALFASSMFVDMMPYKYAWLAFGLMAITRSVVLSEQDQPASKPWASSKIQSPTILIPTSIPLK